MKAEQKVYNKYKREISKIIRAKYKRKAHEEAKIKKIYFKSGENVRKKIDEISQELYKTYLPIIEEEIDIRLNEFLNSEKFKKAVKAENDLIKKKLNYKSLKKYQEFEININNTFLKNLYQEVNNCDDIEITEEEIKYILLSIFYKIIDYIKDGYVVKIGTVFKIWLDKRDVRVNLPDVRTRILEDRLIPKIELCKTFGYKLFHSINIDNKAIMNYYKAKMDRFLMLLKVKQSRK